MSNNIIKQHLLSLLDKEVRDDGRKFEEFRKITIEYGISDKNAEGSARVKIGDTEVVAGVKLMTGEPFPDMDDEGSLMVNVELRPLASPEFENGPPSFDSIELSRVVDRGIRESKVIDFKKLCIKKAEKVWLVMVDIYPINDAGNLFDASSLAALAALKDARFPKIEGDVVDYKVRTKKELPLNGFPISCTVRAIGKHFLVDPTVAEEECGDSRLTIAVMDDDSLCAMQKGGDSAFTVEDVKSMIDIAIKATKQLRKELSKK